MEAATLENQNHFSLVSFLPIGAYTMKLEAAT